MICYDLDNIISSSTDPSTPSVDLGVDSTSLDILLFNKRIENALNTMIEEQQITNKYLRKIYSVD